jgi:hypothetical protein
MTPLEQQLKELFAERAGDIPDEATRARSVAAPPSRRRTGWVGALAAAAAVIAVIGGVSGIAHYVGGDAAPPKPGSSDVLPPVPTGQSAISALGVELFVPTEIAGTVKGELGGCSGAGSGIFYGNYRGPVAACAAALDPQAISIAVTRVPSTQGQAVSPAGTCIAVVLLRTESGCVYGGNFVSMTGASFAELSVQWPIADILVRVQDPDLAAAMAIIKSIHPIGIDRNHCSPNAPPSLVSSEETSLNASATSASVCWYEAGRLRQSSYLSGSDVDIMRQLLGNTSPTSTVSCSYFAPDYSVGAPTITITGEKGSETFPAVAISVCFDPPDLAIFGGSKLGFRSFTYLNASDFFALTKMSL